MQEGSDKRGLIERRSADGRVTLWVPAARLDAALAAGLLADQELARCREATVTGLGGRGAPIRLPFGAEHAIAKTLRRGGVAGRVVRGGFASPARLLAVLELQVELERRGVAVPQLAFGRAREVGSRFVLEFATMEQLGVQDGAVLLAQPLPGEERRALLCAAAAAIRSLHAAGVVHADLNAKNLLFARAPARCWIIDFDGSRCGAPLAVAAPAAVSNLSRLLRSAEKLGLVGTALGPRDLAAFVRAYCEAAQASTKERLALWCAVRRDYSRTIAWHRLGWRLLSRAGDRDSSPTSPTNRATPRSP